MKRTLLTISAAAWVAVSLAACRTAPSHPPTFNDLHELAALKPDKHSPLLNQQNMRKMTELFQAMQFTPTDLARIRDSGDVRLLAGRRWRSPPPDNPLAPANCSAWPFPKRPDDPALLADLAYRAIRFSAAEGAVSEPEFLEALDRWRKLEPENSVPYYLEAAWRANEGKFADAARALAEASRHPKFDSYCAALRLDAVAAGEFAGYPKFTARYLALSFRGEAQLGNAGWRCLDWEGANEQAARDCIVLGKRLEAEKTLLLGEFMGLTLQSVGHDEIPSNRQRGGVGAHLVERVNRIREISDQMNALSRAAYPERAS